MKEVAMSGEDLSCRYPAGAGPVTIDLPCNQPCDDLDTWDPTGPSRVWDDLWDAFDLDDETAEAVPEAGDFWDWPDREEET
jgi:hypothetical protein